MINRLGYSKEFTDFSEEELQILKENLTVKADVLPDYDYGQVEPFSVYRTSKTRIYMPKFYAIERFGHVEKKYKKTVDIKCTFNGTLMNHQVKFCETLLNEIKQNDSCIACSGTGSGKTTIALWLISQLCKKTLIIVHKEFLMNQWIERIKQFLPEAKIGIIRGEKTEIENNDIVIGMIQTLTSREYEKGTFDSIGTVVMDEAHHLAAAKFSQVLFKCGARYSLALSATPKRKDGLTKVLQWFLGSIITNQIASNVDTPSVKILNAEYSSEIKPKHNFKGVLNSPELINQLVADEKRNNLIVRESLSYVSHGRKQLILTGRRNHCYHIEKMIKEKNKDVSTGIYIGGMKEKDLNESNKADIIIATYQSVSEGYDNPSIDTLIMATGIGDVTQSIGRILRRKNVNTPLVIDITDKEYLMGQARRRLMYYKKNNFHIVGNKEKENEPDISVSMFVN